MFPVFIVNVMSDKWSKQYKDLNYVIATPSSLCITMCRLLRYSSQLECPCVPNSNSFCRSALEKELQFINDRFSDRLKMQYHLIRKH